MTKPIACPRCKREFIDEALYNIHIKNKADKKICPRRPCAPIEEQLPKQTCHKCNNHSYSPNFKSEHKCSSNNTKYDTVTKSKTKTINNNFDIMNYIADTSYAFLFVAEIINSDKSIMDIFNQTILNNDNLKVSSVVIENTVYNEYDNMWIKYLTDDVIDIILKEFVDTIITHIITTLQNFYLATSLAPENKIKRIRSRLTETFRYLHANDTTIKHQLLILLRKNTIVRKNNKPRDKNLHNLDLANTMNRILSETMPPKMKGKNMENYIKNQQKLAGGQLDPNPKESTESESSSSEEYLPPKKTKMTKTNSSNTKAPTTRKKVTKTKKYESSSSEEPMPKKKVTKTKYESLSLEEPMPKKKVTKTKKYDSSSSEEPIPMPKKKVTKTKKYELSSSEEPMPKKKVTKTKKYESSSSEEPIPIPMPKKVITTKKYESSSSEEPMPKKKVTTTKKYESLCSEEDDNFGKKNITKSKKVKQETPKYNNGKIKSKKNTR